MGSVMTVQFTFGDEGRSAVFVVAFKWFDLGVTAKVLLEIRVLRESAPTNRANVWFVALKITRRLRNVWHGHVACGTYCVSAQVVF